VIKELVGGRLPKDGVPGGFFIAVAVRDISPCVSSRKFSRCESTGLSEAIRMLVAPAGAGGIASIRILRAFGSAQSNSNIIQPPFPLTTPFERCAQIFQDDAQDRKIVGADSMGLVECRTPLFLTQMPAIQFFDV